MKILRKILISILILTGLIIISGLLLSRFYEDEITQYAVNGINKQIRTKVEVENVKLSFLKKFPNASLEFENVLMRSVPDFTISDFRPNTDTLLFADHLYLQFDVIKLLKRKFIIKEVHLKSGILNVLTDKAGKTNYEFWNRKNEQEAGGLSLELDNVKLSDVQMVYLNRALDMNLSSHIERSNFKGKFSNREFSLNASIEGIIREYHKDGFLFIRNQSILSTASMYITSDIIDIESGDIQFSGQKLSLTGEIIREDPLLFKLSAKGERLKIENIVQYLASSSEKFPEDMLAGGALSFNAKITGYGSKTLMPGILADFTISEAWLKTGKLSKVIREIRTDGLYTNGSGKSPESTLVELKNSSLQYGNSRIGGNLSFENLTQPRINHNLKLELDLSEIQELIDNDSVVVDMEGILKAELNASGIQNSLIKISREELLGNDYNVRLSLEKVGFRLPGPSISAMNIDGEMVFGDYLQISALSGDIAGNHLSFSGRGDNLQEFLFTDKGNLWLNLDMYSDNVDLNKFLKTDSTGISKNAADTIKFPDRIYLKSRFWFDELISRNFSASNVMGDVFYKPGRLEVNNLILTSMDGLINAEGLVEQQSNNLHLIKVMSDVSRIDIQKVFKSFNNFGQDFIMERHLRGSLSGKVHFSAFFNERMKIDKESILSDCDIIIRNGELLEFEPMQKLSRFIDVEELENVSFSTLTNEIYIRNKEVLIPRMDISSSAFNITGSGVHGFDKYFEYKVKVSLSDLLSGKAIKPDRQAEQFGAIEDDGLGNVFLYLIIQGTPEGSNIKYDRKGAILNIRDQLKEEKTVIKEILNEEFGLFKKDSLVFQEDEGKTEPAFIIEWEEDEGSDSLRKDVLKRGNKTESGGFTIRWEEEELSDTLDDKKQNRRSLFKKR
jgi:hypothetical protein